jgi:hypothetical protein
MPEHAKLTFTDKWRVTDFWPHIRIHDYNLKGKIHKKGQSEPGSIIRKSLQTENKSISIIEISRCTESIKNRKSAASTPIMDSGCFFV